MTFDEHARALVAALRKYVSAEPSIGTKENLKVAEDLLELMTAGGQPSADRVAALLAQAQALPNVGCITVDLQLVCGAWARCCQ